MSTEFSADIDDDDEDTGSGLRAKLEAQIKTNRKLQDELTLLKAEKVLGEKGFDLVSAEDLKGVALEELESKAQQLQEERAGLQASLLRKALEKQGFAGDELEDLVSEMVAQKSADTEVAEATERMRSLGSLDGRPVPKVDPSKLHAEDAIRFAVEAGGKSKRS